MGAGSQASHYRVWEELGAVQGREIVYYDEVIRFEDSDGKVFNLYADIDCLEQHMKELAPEGKKVEKSLLTRVLPFLGASSWSWFHSRFFPYGGHADGFVFYAQEIR